MTTFPAPLFPSFIAIVTPAIRFIITPADNILPEELCRQ